MLIEDYLRLLLLFNAFQGCGKPLWLLHGLFRANGGCGYVKKPDFLIDQQAFNPMQPGHVKQTLKVHPLATTYLYMVVGYY